jgi:molybdopterin molybdotransferase
MLSVEQARGKILAGLRPMPEEVVPLSQGWGRVLARDIAARTAVPPADVSAMDGYALKAADIATAPATLRVVGSAPAGHPYIGHVGPGQAVRLFTGSVVPQGCDVVVAQEDTSRQGDAVTINITAAAGRHIRRMAGDFAVGDVLVRAPKKLTARDIGMAAAANHPWLTLRRRPRVAILATGDEIFLPGDPVEPGGVVSSNSHALAALVRASGGEPLLLPIALDTPESLVATAEAARGADLLVTSGGASVGEFDLIQSVLGPRGLSLDFWQIAMRPGKPLMFGRFAIEGGQGMPLLGLPGNPVSAMVCAILFLVPAISVLLGLPGDPPSVGTVLAGVDLPANDHRADHLRATIAPDAAGNLVATPFPVQDSGMLARLAWADGLVLRAPHAPAVARGTAVQAILLGALGI